MRNIQSYQKLDFENKLYWCTAIVSSIHAIVAAQVNVVDN